MEKEDVKILALTWNTHGVRICESLDQKVNQNHRTGLFKTWIHNCEIFDMFAVISEKINQTKPMIVAIGFQEYSDVGSYAHNYLFPEEMPKIGYTEIGNEGLKSVSQMSGVLKNGLRLLVYIRKDVDTQITGAIKNTFKSFKSSYGPTMFGKSHLKYPMTGYELSSSYPNGGIVAYLKLPGNQIIALLNIFLPFDEKNMKSTYEMKDQAIRTPSLDINVSIFNDIYDQLINKSPVNVNYVIALGDFNFRIAPYNDFSPITIGTNLFLDFTTNPKEKEEIIKRLKRTNGIDESYQDIIKNHDEYLTSKDSHRIYQLNEGISPKEGTYQLPKIMPTCIMKIGRDPDNISLQSYEMKYVPSLCDRILYKTINPISGSSELYGIEYGAIDQGITTLSDHAAVYGLFGFRYKS